MKRITLLAAFLIAVFALLAGCAETRDPLEGGIGFHPADWATPGSDNNHAAVLASEGLPESVRESCSGCHGADYGKPGDDCFLCHTSGGEAGHPENGFIPPFGADFHGQKVIDAAGTDGCGGCHAWESNGKLDFDLGGWSQQDCNVCHAGGRSGHPAATEWFNPSSPGFHGKAAAGGMITDCAQCHGADYLGGWTGVSCNDCHVSGGTGIHPDGWIGATTTEGTHGWLLAQGELALPDCQACHGATWDGGWSGRDCTPCHSF